MRIRIIITAVALSALFASDALAQRSRFSRRRAPQPEPAEEKEEKKKPETKKEVENWLAVKGGDVYLGTGQLVRRATVLIGDDKIKQVGHDLEIPEDATVIDATGKAVTPGFVVVRARGMGAPRSTGDDPADGVNPFDPQIKMGLSAGITSFLNSFSSGSSKPAGSSCVVKLAWGDPEGMIVAKDTVYWMRVPLTPMQWRTLRESVEKAREHIEALAKFEKEGGTNAKDEKGKAKKPPKEPSGTKEILKILRGETRLWVTSSGMYDNPRIRQALDLAELFGEGVVLDSPVTAWCQPDAIAATGSMAIILPRQRMAPDKGRPDDTGSNLASASLLSKAGVPVAVLPSGGRFGGSGLGTNGLLGHDLHTLHLEAAYAVRGGMDNRKALRTITLDAARIIGADDRIGSIEVGKDADLLILDGDPLHYRTFVETAIVNGKVVYEKDEEPFYRHIKR